MKIHIEDVIHFPRELAYQTYRDEIVNLVPYLPNIQSIEVLERETLPNGDTRFLNLWKAAETEIPTVVRPFIKPELMKWHDYAVWHNGAWSCDWRTEVAFLKDQVKAGGTNVYIPQGDNAVKIVIQGEITVDAHKIPGIPGLMAGRIGSTVESFVVKLIEPNLKGINRGLERYLQSKK
jgi:hypothetical protein